MVEAGGSTRRTVGLVGARGHTGAELVRLLAGHPRLTLAFASSRQAAGRPLDEVVPGTSTGLVVEDLGPERVAARRVDAVVLALPNGASEPWLAALDPSVVVVDLSADHRFDDAWLYGLPELPSAASTTAVRSSAAAVRRIANPGCYATGLQLAVAPLLPRLARDAVPQIFGVSGYSGAGTTPSPNNDPARLRDNVVPYSMVDHVHEREASRHLGRSVFFTPHVAPFFRGITLTASIPLALDGLDGDGLYRLFAGRYADEPLVRVIRDVPLVRDAVGRHDVTIGGFAVDPHARRAVVIATLDNLLKGAATQAVQNLNLALGIEEHTGIPRPPG